MSVAHYNYYPPSGSVLDQNEPSAYWDGKNWKRNKKNYAVPSGHRLVGRAGGPLNGWYFDWSQRAWMEPSPASAPTTAIQPRAPRRPAAPTQPQTIKPAAQPEKESHMGNCASGKHSRTAEVMEIIKVVSYIAGPIALAVGQSLKAPSRPPVTPVQPQWLIAENQNRYEENKTAYEGRQGVWTNVGQALLTFGSSGLSKGDKEEIEGIVRNVVTKKAA